RQTFPGVLHDQKRWNGNRAISEPVHYRGAWRASVGGRQRRAGRDILIFHSVLAGLRITMAIPLRQSPSPDLDRLTAFPTPATGTEPSQIVSCLLDTLLGTLPLSFAFARLNDPEGGPSIALARTVEPLKESIRAAEISEALKLRAEDALPECAFGAQVF